MNHSWGNSRALSFSFWAKWYPMKIAVNLQYIDVLLANSALIDIFSLLWKLSKKKEVSLIVKNADAKGEK